MAPDINPPEQYSDGPNPYLFVRGNPTVGLDPSGEFTLIELMKTAGIRGFQVYEGVSVALSFRQLVGNIADAVSERNFTLDSISEIAASAGDFGLEIATGPALRWLGRYAVALGKSSKRAMGALAAIGEHRRRAQAIMREVLEEGLEKAAKQRHHMIPVQLLKRLQKEAPDVYKAVVGKKGEPNIFEIPTKLHAFLHSEKAITGPGGWWNEMWMDAYEAMTRGGMGSAQMIDQLKQMRDLALGKLGVLEMMR